MLGIVFKFAAPDGWQSLQEGGRHIFHGPNREELIVSASLIEGIGTTGNLAAMRQNLFQNVEQSVKNAAAHPALKVTQPFQKQAIPSNVECWSLRTQTHEEDTLFYQAVCRDSQGVLLITLEAPNTTPARHIFQEFLKSVEVVSESEALIE